MLKRTMAVVAAFGLGWVVYMIGMVLTVYDGVLSLIFQPFIAALVSGVCVAGALLIGLLLRIPALSRWWTSLRAVFVACGSLFVLVFGYFIGFTYIGTNPETGSEVVTLHPVAALGGYFLLLFAVANWPMRVNQHPNGPHDTDLRSSA